MMTVQKPAPRPSDHSRLFWEACQRHELRIQQCTVCKALLHYPKVRCPNDGSDRFDWCAVSGRGTVFSYIVVHRAFHAAFMPDPPYVVAVVELEEGVRLMSNVIGVDHGDVRVGMPVHLTWDDASGPYPLPKFTPLKSDSK